jgi:hypothetical protein
MLWQTVSKEYSGGHRSRSPDHRFLRVRTFELARRGAGRGGARQTFLTDVDALIEVGGVVFRVALGDAGALSVGVFGLLGARGHNGHRGDQDAECAKGTAGAQAPRLIPLISHRYLPETPNEADNPVFPVYRSDAIHYGIDLADYFEFVGYNKRPWPDQIKHIPF